MAGNKEFKIASIVVVFLVALGGAVLPTIYKKRPNVLSYMNVFAAGVFLLLGLSSILKGAAEDLEEISEDMKEFPLAYVLCAVGFYIIFLAEEIGHGYLQKLLAQSTTTSHSVLDSLSPVTGYTQCHDGVREEGGTENPQIGAQDKQNPEIQSVSGSLLAAFILMIALSMHELLEGLALGATDDFSWSLFIAIIFQKFVEAFALGAAFIRAEVSQTLYWAVLGLFSLTLPIGIGMGMALNASGGVATGILLALSSGSFLYISTVEILPEEFGHRRVDCNGLTIHRSFKIAFLLLGSVVAILLGVWEEASE